MHAQMLMRNATNGNRGKFEIVAEILTQLSQPTGKTNLMSHCNMNFAQSGLYLTFMRSNGLIEKDTMAGKTKYQRTEAGREYLKLYKKMATLLDPSISALP